MSRVASDGYLSYIDDRQCKRARQSRDLQTGKRRTELALESRDMIMVVHR